CVSHLDSFFRPGDGESKMQTEFATGSERHLLGLGSKTFGLDLYRVATEGKVVEAEFARSVAGCIGDPFRCVRPDRYFRALDGTVLRVMDETSDGAENRGADAAGKQQQSAQHRGDT